MIHINIFPAILLETLGTAEGSQVANSGCLLDWLIDFLVFNATFNNISVISWRPVLLVEEAGVPGKDHRPWASNW